MKPRELVRAALIAAVYALLTVAVAPISSGLLQCRVSEALCVLPYFTFSAVPGLFVGCVIANLMLGAPVWDVLFGSLATLIAALLTWFFRRRLPKALAPAPSVLVNAVVIGAVLCYGYQIGVSYPLAAAYVFLGQALACYGLGMPLLLVLERCGKKLFDA